MKSAAKCSKPTVFTFEYYELSTLLGNCSNPPNDSSKVQCRVANERCGHDSDGVGDGVAAFNLVLTDRTRFANKHFRGVKDGKVKDLSHLTTMSGMK